LSQPRPSPPPSARSKAASTIPATGEYLELARISVEGTLLETLTDSAGHYRLSNVPAGPVRLRAFRTGVASQTVSVTVTAGGIAQQDFELGRLDSSTAGQATVQLEKFVVGTSKEMDGAAIAINTQRFAPNVMNVVAADEYSAMTEGGVGELLKAVPGMNVEIGGGGEPYLLSMNGVPPANVPVTISGFSLANATAGTSRQTGIEQISMNNVSRIEVSYTPTPETTGSALAGGVNLVPRSAFERSRPVYRLTGYYAMRDHELNLGSTPGPVSSPTPKVRPGIDFSAIVPVNNRLGFTLSASTSSVYTGADFIQRGWRGVNLATNGAAFPDTTVDQPYLTDFSYGDQPKLTKRYSFGGTLDLKLTRNDRVSLSYMHGFIDFYSNNRSQQFFITNVTPGNFSTDFTRGNNGEIRNVNNTGVFGGRVLMPAITYAHTGSVWKIDAGAGHSHSTRHNKNINNGHFNNVQARRLNTTVSYFDNTYLRPGTIAVSAADGTPLDPYSLDTYTLNTATGAALAVSDLQRSVYAHARRDFHGRIPFALKAGIDVKQIKRDQRNAQSSYTFVGADGVPNTADDNARIARDDSFSTRTPGYGFPQTDWISNHRLWDLWQSNPGYFTLNQVAQHNNTTAQSKYAEEILSAVYLRGDVQLFNGRLKLVGGVRAEQVNVEGQGQLIDPTRNFQYDSAGRPVLGANGRPLPITTNALQAAQLTTIDRGLQSKKEYLRLFPSLNAAYSIRENLIARAGYYHSVGRPNLVQYAGALTLPDTELPPAPNNRISVNNAGIKAWTARTVKVTLEYYFEKVGLVSIAGFHRNIENFFGSTVFRATPQFLGLYSLDPAEYGDYDVATQYNLSSPVRMSGVDFNYKQALTFLPNWARGVQVYANASALRATGDNSNNFQGYVPRTANWGVSLTREKFKLQTKWNYSGKRRNGPVAQNRGIDAATYNWTAKRLLVDVIGQYNINKRWSVFANLNNVGDTPNSLEISSPNTPEIAQFRQRIHYGSLWTVGVKAEF
jgi:TonB-dependent receptor